MGYVYVNCAQERVNMSVRFVNTLFRGNRIQYALGQLRSVLCCVKISHLDLQTIFDEENFSVLGAVDQQMATRARTQVFYDVFNSCGLKVALHSAHTQ